MRKTLCVFAVTALLAATITGCSGKSGSETTAAQTTGEETTETKIGRAHV